MAEISFGFEDTDATEFVDWDCVWRDWIWKTFKTISKPLGPKYNVHPVALKYQASEMEARTQVQPLGTKYVVHSIGKKTSVVEKL